MRSLVTIKYKFSSVKGHKPLFGGRFEIKCLELTHFQFILLRVNLALTLSL